VPHFTLTIGPAGPLLIAYIGVSKPREEALKKAGQQVPQRVQIQALVDTGASVSGINPAILTTKLGLTPTGTGAVHTPSSAGAPMPIFDVSLTVPPGRPGETMLYLETLPVIGCDLTAQGFHGLIGRDILQACVLFYNGRAGHFTLAF
jgi:hypothetical protein